MSTIAPYKAELTAAITAGVPGLQVIYGPAPDVTTLAPDVLIVGNVLGSTTFGSLARPGRVRESYDVTLTVSCSRPGPDSQADATAAAFGFRDAVAALLPTLTPSTPGVMSAQVDGQFDLTEDDSPSSTVQRNAALVFTVHVESSI